MSAPPPPPEPGRASLLATLGVFLGLTVIVVVVSLAWPASRRARRSPWSPASASASAAIAPPREAIVFLGPLAAGASFDGWTLLRVDPLKDGHLPVHLSNGVEDPYLLVVAGRAAGAPEGIASSETLSVFANTPPGSQTPKAVVAAAQALARALAARERAGAPRFELRPMGGAPPLPARGASP